jgi:protein KRI1
MPRKSSASKRELNGDAVVADRPEKKAKLLDNTDDEGSEDETGAGFKVNEEYARRFEHNKKRAEQHRRRSFISRVRNRSTNIA